MSTIVKSQAEFDAALTALGGKFGLIEIRSPEGIWIQVGDTGSATVRASGSATVEASGSATVEAWDSATVEAWDSATVRAWGSATVRASGSATVEARDSATVEARDSATVEAWGSATVRATPHVAVHLRDQRVTVSGGVLIDVTKVNDTAEAWCEHHGIEITDGKATLFKAVHDDWQTDRKGWIYRPGETVVAEDFDRTRVCGGGLHLCARPWLSARYLTGATKYVACEVDVADLIPLDDKCKVREVRVLHEVDIDGNRIEVIA